MPNDSSRGQSAPSPGNGLDDDHLIQALQAHQAGRLDEATVLYRKALTQAPRHPDANHNLAIALIQGGRPPSEALPLFKIAWAEDPTNRQYGVSLLRALMLSGAHGEAQRVFEEASRRHVVLPDPSVFKPQAATAAPEVAEHVKARLDRDLSSARARGDRRALRDVAGAMTQSHPSYAPAWAALATAQEHEGAIAEALSSIRRAISLGAQDPNTILVAAKLEFRAGLIGEALRSYQAAERLWPGDARIQIGVSLCRLANHQHAEAEQAARRAVALEPATPESWSCLAQALLARGDQDGAGNALAEALKQDPDLTNEFALLGKVLMDSGRWDAAEALCKATLARNPSRLDALYTLGTLMLDQGNVAEAESCYRQVRQQDPLNFAARSSLLFTQNYLENASSQQRLDEARLFGRDAATRARPPLPPWQGDAKPAQLRVGLMSGDLRFHPVGYFLEGMLQSTQGSQVSWVGFSSCPYLDETSDRLRAAMQGWHNLNGLSDRDAAQRIRDEGVHVLIDLSGHTVFNRLPVLAWKPAPVQVSWLGYFATTGMAAIDYVLADAVCVPPAAEGDFVERIWRLPTRLCFTPPAWAPEPTPGPVEASGVVTFGCFQAHPKINDRVLALWGRILESHPGARLRIQNANLSSQERQRAFEDRLQRAGVPVNRVDLRGATSRMQYLSDLNAVDILLDTFPYPGGTTTCEALWMGVPTVTLAGSTMLARQGASMLSAAGLPDWIADSEERYVFLALAKSTAGEELSQLRRRLRSRLMDSRLFNAELFSRDLVDALWGMWASQRDHGKRPQ